MTHPYPSGTRSDTKDFQRNSEILIISPALRGWLAGDALWTEGAFGGFGTVSEHRRKQSPPRTLAVTPTQEKKPRGRPPRALTAQRGGAGPSPSSVLEKPEGQERLAEKAKRLPGRPPGSGEKRRGRPPASHASTAAHRKVRAEDGKERKATKRTPLGSVQHDTEAKPLKASCVSKVTKLKRLREVKLSPLKSRLKAIARKCLPVDPHTPQQQSKLRASHVAEDDDSPNVHSSSPPSSPLAESSPSKLGRPLNLRTSPRHVNPVRIVPPSKRTDATIAKQLLQRAKKGAQKKKLLEKEAVAIESQGGAGMEAGIRKRRRTQLKNIRQFIMPVVSTVSLRIIKTPKRFIEDEGSFGAPHPHMKMARFDAVPHPVAAPQPALASSPMRASTAAVATAAATASSRSSSPSLDDSSCDSQASEGTQALSERDHSPSSQGEREGDLLHTSRPLGSLGARGRGSLATGGKKAIISPATGVLMNNSQQAASTASSSPPPPPLLSPPLQAQSGSITAEHHPHSPWILPHPFRQGPSLVLSSLQDKRRSILREPTFRWTSRSRTEQQYFSSAKRWQHPSSRFESPLQKRSPLLRAPRFTPSEAHSRIFESVTLQSSSGSSPGSLSPLQSSPKSGRSVRRRRRKTLGPLRGQPRSPSHSMTTRSSQPGAPSGKAPSELAAGSLGGGTGGNSASSSSSQLFPLFTSSPQETGRGAGKGGRERSTSVSRDSAPVKELERETEKSRERLPLGQTGSKKPPAVPSLGSMLAHAEKLPRVAGLLKKAKAQLFKIEKSKSLKSPDHPKVQSQESDSSETSVRGPRIKHVCRRAAVALGRNRAVFPDDMPTLSALPWEEREKILSSMGNDDKSSVAGSEEAEPQSPPIKPVMRHTKTIQEGGAVPRKGRRSRRCGQCPGCQVPEDCGVCTNCLDKPKFGGRNIKKQCCKVRKCQNLQWMPSKIFLQKQGKGKKDKKNKLSEKKEALHPVKDPTSAEPSLKPAPPPLKEEPPHKKSETPPPKPGEEKHKLPQLQSPPAENPTLPNDQPPQTHSCATALGQDQKHLATAPTGAASRKERKPQQPTPPSSPFSSSPQSSPSPPTPQPPQQRPQPTQGPPKKEGGGAPKSPPTEAKGKPQQQCLATPITDTAPEGKQMKKQTPRSVPPQPKPTKPKEKQQKPLATKPETSTLNLLSTPSTGGTAKQKVPSDGVHRIRVDFKKDHDVENVWATGGLSLLTSVPITPRVVCFLCASSGNVEFVFCQVCCEPFHLFCLGETERPLEEQWEDWCCRRCRFCHTCGLQHQKTKQQLLECEKCRNSYHPECLGPNHPTRPTKKKRVWICTKCVRCKSCGATKPGKAWDAQWSHDFSRCHDCAKLFAKGNFCPLCDKCYDDDDYDSKMMQCGRCDHWVHSKCENLTDEMYELLSNLPESVAYTCTSCTKRQPAEWRTALEKELQGLVRRVLTALLNSRTSTHLLCYRQAVMKPPELNPETESLPTRRSPEGPDPPVLTEVAPPNDSPLDLESVEKKLDAGRYKSVLEFSDDIVKIIQTAINSDGGLLENRKANSMVKSFFIRQMERVFPWFKVKESRFWETHKFSTNSGLLPNAVLPPSLDHNYAQWQEREEIARAEQPLRKKIIPAPCSKTHVEPDSPTSPPPLRPLLPPPLPMLHDLSREDSPELLPPPGVSDNRQCVLCLKYGDDHINEGGRLLYIGQNEWTHVNCALWSAEVFEDDDGSLKNVHMAVIRGKQLRCENCQRPGATVGCCLTSCTRNYHFMCARQRHCVFLEDKKVYCQRHRDLIKGEVVSESGFEVTRRILVDLEGISLRRKFLTGLQPENIHMMIGSMTIDCLGMLTELSDCERKLFPVGYQCSRVYWSTLDARKRCVYTCRILVCRPSVVEPDLKSALPEENRTISHSPLTPISEKVPSPVPEPFDSLKPSDRLSLLPSSPNPPKVYKRNRHPSYPPCQRSPGSRPLPSPDGTSQSAHEIVTVGDPLLSSVLRSIGSRRHSTSSLSPQPRQKVVSSSQAAMNQLARLFSSAPPIPLSSSRDLGLREKGKLPASGVRTQGRDTSSLSPGGQHSRRRHSISEMKTDGGKESVPGKQAMCENPKLSPMAPEMTGASQASPPPGTGFLTGHQRASSSNSQAEKGKQDGKDPDLSAGVTLLSRHRVTTTLSKDKGGVTLAPASKDAGKLGSPQPPFHKSVGKKSQDYLLGKAPAAAMKPLWSSEAMAEEDATGGTINAPTPTSQNSKAATLSNNTRATGKQEVEKLENQGSGRSAKSRERFSSPEKNRASLEAIKQPRLASERSMRASQSSCSMLFSPPARSESNSPPLHPEDCEEGGDRDKHHEDDSDCAGSTKRRYPRRSARARSNMFFGLTPFYGVRSYGEQDIPFYSSSGDGPGKRKAGGSRRSAEGQVDGADDRSTSSGDSGEEEEGGFSQCSNKDPYYYNFTRTIINPGPERVVAAVDEGVPTRSLLGHQQIGQLDGVDDSSESDASANTTTTATVATSSHKSTGKRKGRERHTEKLEHDSGKEADNGSGGGGSSGSSSNNIREGRKSQKDNSLPLGGVKSSQGQDPLEAQLSLNTDLKSDSDNNNSDDCGNILPSDIMEFVLNTPSMQALGQQPEAASSELLSLDGGYGVGVNRRKDILFEDFPQPLASTEPVESRVNTSISVEEPYGLPLELPSDLSVLTTRSPTVNNQNHGGLISEGSECTMLSLAASDETITEKGGEDKQQKGGAGIRESQVRGGHMTPVQFEHITSPSLGEVVEAGNKDLTRSSGTPVLPSSPTLPLQGQKYIPPPSSVSPRPSHVASTAVQTTSHLKPGPEKLIVINQHLQPLYVLQTLPNGVMDTMTLTTGLTTGITTSQPIFPAGGKVLGTMPNHPQIHTFTGTTQTGFQPGIPSTTSGLLIGLPSHEPQILVTEAGRRHDLAPNVTIVSSASISTSSAVPASGHGKKRPISRLQPRKTKKLARSRSQPTLGPSEVRPNMTLINLSSPQMAQSELGTLTTAATTSHRKVPNIIKRPKSGVMYFEPIQQRRPLPSGQPGILGHASSTHLLPCTVSGLNPNQSAVLNMVSMAQPSGPGGLITPGSVSLSTPVLSSTEITGPISSLLFKASPHNLLQSGAPLMSQLCSPAQTSIASSICVLPSHQTISMSVRQQVDPESGVFQRQQHPPNASGQHVAPAPSPVQQDSDKGHLVGVLSQSSSSQSSHTMPKSRSSSEQKQELKCSAAVTASTCSGKGKQKAKRTRQSPDKASGKKHKGWLAEPPREMQGDQPTSVPGSRETVSPEPMDTGKPRERGTSKNDYSAKSAEPPSLTSKTSEFPEEKSETTAGSLLVASPDQEGSRRDSSMDSKPKKGLIFEICSDDGFQIRCESIEEAWKSLTDKVQEARSNARLKELSFEGVNGLRMLGVLHDAVVFLLEQLYGSRHCRNYRFRFHKPKEADEPPINPHGSARAELNHRRSVFDMFNFLASKHRQPPEYNPHEEDEEVQLKSARRATSMDLPMPMRFRHLKRTSKEAVGVYRSAIHGRGLFCKRSIDVGEMVIEYSGNVIRSVLTDKREKYYDGKGVGCYMFRIDDYEVVDATVHGNAARFINHSCEPNCYSRVINVDGQKHIVIFATRKIYRGEELTYDYKFPIEEPGNKLPCNCGTKKCRKFLN
ncbi:unnamed protein product [Oncorhynchus mykiss]|uniref:Histone-lysine N-methyltransferase n=1 Tax=Oncorhynchus mykiss TaxID=8022 RepID=A0A060VWN3_ONCMY|nr:unnamed protein product [Oncorhynchus mykiss]